MRNPVRPSSCVMTPAGTPNELDVQNVWKKSYTHTRTHTLKKRKKKADRPGGSVGNLETF